MGMVRLTRLWYTASERQAHCTKRYENRSEELLVSIWHHISADKQAQHLFNGLFQDNLDKPTPGR